MKRIQFTTILALGLLAGLAAPQNALAAPAPPFLLADINLSAGNSNPNDLTALKGKLYFQASEDTHGAELWRFDPGTVAVDVDGDGYQGCATGDNPCQLADIYSGGVSSSPSEFAVLSGKLFFQAFDGSDWELWVYDPDNAVVDNGSYGYLGCATGDNPCQLADLNPTGDSDPAGLTALGGKLYFSAIDDTHGYELWRYDPAAPVEDVASPGYLGCDTGDNPCLLADLNPGGGGSAPGGFAAMEGKLYFNADDGTQGYELWRYDPGTAAVDVDGDGYLACDTGDNPCLLADLYTGGSSSPEYFTALNGKLYFQADNGTHGRELWRYDSGTAAVDVDGDGYLGCDTGDNPCLLADLNPSTGHSYSGHLTILGGKLYFQAADNTDAELWVYDPGTIVVDIGNNGYQDCSTGDNPCKLADLNPGGNSNPAFLTTLSGKLYFWANDGTHGHEVWRYDPALPVEDVGTIGYLACDTGDNPCQLADLYPGAGYSDPYDLTPLKGKLYIPANDGTHGYELWVYDAGPIFTDGFESGDLSAWSGFFGAVEGEGYNTRVLCNLCVTATAPLVDSYSLRVKLPNNKPHFVQDDSPSVETEYHARFMFKRGKTLKMGSLNNFKLLLAKNGAQTPFFLQVRKKGTMFQIRAVAKLDNGKIAATNWTALPRAAVSIGVDWLASSGTNDGYIKLYLNDVLKHQKTGLDNDTYAVDLVRWGMAAKFKAAFTISGSFKLDAFNSDRAAHVGP